MAYGIALGSVTGDGAHICVPKKTGTTFTFGTQVLDSHSSENVVVDSVDLADGSGLQLVHALLVPIQYNGFGTDAYPPVSTSKDPGVEWNNRRPAVGATIVPQAEDSEEDPANGGTQSAESPTAVPDEEDTENPTRSPQPDLVLALRVTGTSGVRMSGVTVNYHSGGHTYVWRNLTELRVETKKSHC
jgi:hypothetical protein